MNPKPSISASQVRFSLMMEQIVAWKAKAWREPQPLNKVEVLMERLWLPWPARCRQRMLSGAGK